MGANLGRPSMSPDPSMLAMANGGMGPRGMTDFIGPQGTPMPPQGPQMSLDSAAAQAVSVPPAQDTNGKIAQALMSLQPRGLRRRF